MIRREFFHSGEGHRTELPLDFNDFEVAARESSAAFEEHRLWAFLRHARLSEEQASDFWRRIRDLVEEYDRLPRSGDMTYGLAVGIYPIRGYPSLPDASGNTD